MPTDSKHDQPGRKPGSAPEHLKIDVPFEDAVRRVLQTPKPPEGWPEDVKRTRVRRGPGKRQP